jgi:hypothetical protein
MNGNIKTLLEGTLRNQKPGQFCVFHSILYTEKFNLLLHLFFWWGWDWGFEFMPSHLQSRYSTGWATPPAPSPFCFSYFSGRILNFCPMLPSDHLLTPPAWLGSLAWATIPSLLVEMEGLTNFLPQVDVTW